MLPAAYMLHTMQNRTRLRVPARKGDVRFFAHVEQVLGGYDGVAYVEANPLTGSILLRHTVDLADVTHYALKQELFTLQPHALPEKTLLNLASDQIDQAERSLQRMTQGTIDLNELLFAGLLGAIVLQIVRGKILGPVTTLISSAATILALHRAKRAAKQ